MGLLVEHVNKSFAEIHVIKDLSMEVQEGAIFGFLGANGAGKTTTMRMILDILRPDTGHITWNGEDVREVPRRSWGYLPEERGLYPKMRVDEQLLFLARLQGLSKQDKEAFLEMHRRGKTIIFSTHQLEQVEELCQHIVIINKGQSVVQGSVQQDKRHQSTQITGPGTATQLPRYSIYRIWRYP
ncbi:MAG TPA: ATP-binding cassette domain-containing protein, partial [Ktedonobacteraceae bacterium]|nr:ATP-binding cassette domain-containing protein [Ktedonobacteraceae bacterium]